MYFGSILNKVEGYVAVEHVISGEIRRMVNSYHAYAVDIPGNGIYVMACTELGDIEAMRHMQYPIYGIMWHPERGDAFDEEDIRFIKEKLSI